MSERTAGETIFRGTSGNAINHDSFADHFDRDVRRWGGKRIRFHDLRHTATTLLIRSGVDLKTVKEICGHQNISTTMNYAHLVEGSVNQVARSFSITPIPVQSIPTATRLRVVSESR